MVLVYALCQPFLFLTTPIWLSIKQIHIFHTCHCCTSHSFYSRLMQFTVWYIPKHQKSFRNSKSLLLLEKLTFSKSTRLFNRLVSIIPFWKESTCSNQLINFIDNLISCNLRVPQVRLVNNYLSIFAHHILD